MDKKLTSVGKNADEQVHRRLASGPHEFLNACPMKNWKSDPEDENRKCANERPKRHREQHTSPGRAPIWWACHTLVQNFVEAIQNRTDTNNDISESPVACLLCTWIRWFVATPATL